jgi:hypothetical protein
MVDKHYSVVLSQSGVAPANGSNLRQKTSRNLPQIPSLKLTGKGGQQQLQQQSIDNGTTRIRLTSINNSQDMSATQVIASNSKGFT